MMQNNGQPSCGTWWNLFQWGHMTHGEQCRGSLDKAGLFVRDLE